VVDDEGNLVKDYILLLTLLHILNNSCHEIKKIFLPAWAPDFVEYKNLEITKGKFGGFKAKQLKEYDLIANTDGHFAFSEFGLSTDAVFSSFKFLECLGLSGRKLSESIKELPEFAYRGENVACPSEYKGKMMRKFLEDGEDKKSSHTDGVKIWLDEKEWILMIPDQHREFLNIYIQAKNDTNANKIFEEYQGKINTWINE
jgi:mannose-1-phosphate guanylyltransferase/phosphomannomutase